MMHEWETVSSTPGYKRHGVSYPEVILVRRMSIPGGWIYHVIGSNPFFVPRPEGYDD